MNDTSATVICPQDQIQAAQATSPDAAGMFTALFTNESNQVVGVSSGRIYCSTLNALSEAQIPGLLFRFPEGQIQGLTPYNPEAPQDAAPEPVQESEPVVAEPSAT